MLDATFLVYLKISLVFTIVNMLLFVVRGQLLRKRVKLKEIDRKKAKKGFIMVGTALLINIIYTFLSGWNEMPATKLEWVLGQHDRFD